MMTTVCCWSFLAVLLMLSWEPAFSQERCFSNYRGHSHSRQMYYNGKGITIMLAGSYSVSQNITNHILKILLEEKIGYGQVDIWYLFADTYNATVMLDRLSGCSDTGCTEGSKAAVPRIMVNLEVPVSLGFATDRWTDHGHVVETGKLGPNGRRGWYIPSFTVSTFWDEFQITADHWRSLFLPEVARNLSLQDHLPLVRNLTKWRGKYWCKSQDCIDGILYGKGCSPSDSGSHACPILLASYPVIDSGALQNQVQGLELPVNVAWIGNSLRPFVKWLVNKGQPALLFDYYPDVLALGTNFTRINFPDCWDQRVQSTSNCEIGNDQLLKFVWPKIKTNAPEAFHVISKMNFQQIDFEGFVRNYTIDESAFTVACDWLKKSEDKWKPWLPDNLSINTKIYLLGLFPITGERWRQPGLVQGAELAVERVNQNRHVLPHHDLEVIVVDTQCKPDVAMKEFIRYVQNDTTTPIAGILGPACSDEAEPIASLSKHFNMFTVSYGAEASSLADRATYPYFYRTIPQVSLHRYVYEKFLQAMDWVQVGALAEAGQELPEYHLLLQDHLQKKGVSVLVKHDISHTPGRGYDVSGIFADLRAQNVRIIIADFYVKAARAVMCEAYRQRMTAHEGYVWFLPSWYSPYWWDVNHFNSHSHRDDEVPCSTDNMLYAIDGHFVLSKTISDSDQTVAIGNFTVGKFKQMYAEKIGKAKVMASKFASYVYDAVWVYALSLNKLLRADPGALEYLHTKTITENLLRYFNHTDFRGVSGRVRFDGGDRPGQIDIKQFLQNGTTTVGKFNPGHGPSDGHLDIYYDKIKWLTTGGKRPDDGHAEEDKCIIEDFRQMFAVSCEMAIVIANIIGFGTFVILVVFVLVFIKFRYDAKMRSTHDRMKELGLLSSDFSHCLSLDEWEVARNNVVLNRKLGEGAFGTVYGGEAYLDDEEWVSVAVKTLKIGSRVEEKIDFLSEADLMKRFQHPNIVQLLGVCTRGEPVLAIMEYHLHGDLKTYLLSRRSLVGQDSREAEDVSPLRLTQMVLDVASGLKYIHDLRYVHRDLASRNCLVHSSLTVKIGDFGMTRPVIESDYYRFTKKGMLPVRWMSPESLWDGLFTAKSDIWSFGVLVFEVVTFGSFPYQGLSNSQVLEFVKKGSKIILPPNIPQDLCDFILSCQEYEASDRPDIEDIIDKLMKNADFMTPCLDAPITSVVNDEMQSMELLPTSCQNTASKSNSAVPTFLNRLSQTSQDAKRLSVGSQGTKLATPTKLSIKTFVPSVLVRPRSNSIDSPQTCNVDLHNQFEEIQNNSPHQSVIDKTNSRHSQHEVPSHNSFVHCLPLLSPSERADNTSDYFSENSKEMCQNSAMFEMCETITSL